MALVPMEMIPMIKCGSKEELNIGRKTDMNMSRLLYLGPNYCVMREKQDVELFGASGVASRWL